MDSSVEHMAPSCVIDPPSPLEALLEQDKTFGANISDTSSRKRKIGEASEREPERLRRRLISISSPDHQFVRTECAITTSPRWHPRTNIYTAEKHIIGGAVCLNDGLRANFAGCSVPGYCSKLLLASYHYASPRITDALSRPLEHLSIVVFGTLSEFKVAVLPALVVLTDQGVDRKPNQDRLLILHDAPTNSLVVACMDGHGVHGHRVAEAFSNGLESKLCKHPLFRSEVCAAIRNVLVEIEYSLFLQDPRIGDLSGCTLCLAVLRGQRLIIANVGDSRAVLAHRSLDKGSTDNLLRDSTDSAESKESTGAAKPLVQQTRLLVQNVSVDHKPSLVGEHARILAAGGRVFSIRYPDGTVGPPRVWLKYVNAPGLAMSRSLGDFIVHSVGVSSTPDFYSVELSENENKELDYALVLATDGLWDHTSSEEVMAITMQHMQPAVAVSKLLNESCHRWMRKESMVDDTSICVVRLQRRMPPSSGDSH